MAEDPVRAEKKRDPIAYENARLEIAEHLAQEEHGLCRVAFGDESGFTENPPPSYAWAQPGAPHSHTMKGGDRKRLNAIGACDARLAPVSVWFFEGRVGGLEFRRWASAFADSCTPDIPTHLWLDNGPVHTAAATRECFSRWEAKGLIIHFLPPYCPELNRIEIMWRIMKRLRPFALLDMQQMRSCLKNILRQLLKRNRQSKCTLT